MLRRRHISFVKNNYWSKLYASIITLSGVLTIFVYIGFDQKSWKLKYFRLSFKDNIWRLKNACNTKFGMNVSNESDSICQNAGFTIFPASDLFRENLLEG